MGNYGFTILLWITIGLFVFSKWDRTFCIQQMGKPQKEKKVGDRYNVLRKGKVIFWNVSESELFDIMEDLAVECYYNKTLTSKDITYEPYIEEPLDNG